MKKNADKPVEDVQRLATLLELNLKAQGIEALAVEVNFHPEHLEFQLEIARGVTILSLEKLSKDIALYLASPTGKIDLIAPVPGTHRVGINLPRRSKDNIQKYEEFDPIVTVEREVNFIFKIRNLTANILCLAGNICYLLTDKLRLNEKDKVSLTSTPEEEEESHFINQRVSD
jgi:DNA segregation ATPase FtsK/SpoIIIE-like protein